VAESNVANEQQWPATGTLLRALNIRRQASEKPALGKRSQPFASFVERIVGLPHLMLQNANGHGR
jgi:hypothetical protein